jgi:DNA helicase IV
MLDLPDFNDLSPEQDDILDLPLDSSVIVTGPPGTGKTVIAIWRANMLHRAGRPTLLLMYGKLLSTYTATAVKKLGLDSSVSTYHSWFPQFYKETYGEFPPKLAQWKYDWTACKEKMLNSPVPEKLRRHIIVDEGQDMPKDFYLVLRLVSSSMTILADENQRITEDQSTIAEIQAASGVKEVRTLTKNFRNTRQIAEFAASFYVGLPSGIPELPPQSRAGERPILLHHKDLGESVRHLINYEKTYGDHSIGVLVPQVWQLKSLYRRLGRKTRRPVQAYIAQKNNGGLPVLDFAQPGIKLVTWASAKGLQFDTVFLPELQAVKGDPKSDEIRMKMYVLSSRARQRLFLMYTGDGTPNFVDALPFDLLEDRR